MSPQIIDALTCGEAHLDSGELDDARRWYEEAVSRAPDSLDAHIGLGTVLHRQGRLEEAGSQFQQAIGLMPDSSDAHCRLGLVLRDQNRLGEAVASCRRALEIEETPEARRGFVQAVRRAKIVSPDEALRLLVTRAISETWGGPSYLAGVAARFIKLNPGITGCMVRSTQSWPSRLRGDELFGPTGLAAVSADPLLRCLLESTSVIDLHLERFLTMVRLWMLDTATSTGQDVDVQALAFCCALARQCFINEYVFDPTPDESSRAGELREQVATALESGSPVADLALAAVAAYFPLISLPPPAREALLSRTWPEPVRALVIQQVDEPLAEQRSLPGIPRLTPISDEVSKLVRQQYEENPYPRWVRLPASPGSSSIDAFLRRQLPFAHFTPLGKQGDLDVLVAGCGTGQHPILTARQYRDARVLAIDLSLPSLGYARRKTDELGMTNIEYAQADILDLTSIHRTFDVVSSFGVLHHLRDPLAGWTVLTSVLRPGGFMEVALYSEIARQDVVAARDFIAGHGYRPTPEDIRRCRQEFMSDDSDPRFRRLTQFRDFFTMSMCRDLLFHVSEHRFTLPELKSMLHHLDLTFIGFVLEHPALTAYSQRFPDDASRTDLDNWDRFEQDNPFTFVSTYHFWVQKH